jgi:hypothetical protein
LVTRFYHQVGDWCGILSPMNQHYFAGWFGESQNRQMLAGQYTHDYLSIIYQINDIGAQFRGCVTYLPWISPITPSTMIATLSIKTIHPNLGKRRDTKSPSDQPRPL